MEVFKNESTSPKINQTVNVSGRKHILITPIVPLKPGFLGNLI
jgi:hypothetical protein